MLRFNENWGFQAAQIYDALNGTIQNQFYSIFRDMRSWTAAVTIGKRTSTGSPNDITFAFTFSLKASPRYGGGGDLGIPAWLLGG